MDLFEQAVEHLLYTRVRNVFQKSKSSEPGKSPRNTLRRLTEMINTFRIIIMTLTNEVVRLQQEVDRLQKEVEKHEKGKKMLNSNV